MLTDQSKPLVEELMIPLFRTGNIGIPSLENDVDWSHYIVGYSPGVAVEISERNPGVDIKSVKLSTHVVKVRLTGEEDNRQGKIDRETRITILLEGGPWKQEMRLRGAPWQSFILNKPGDYISWEPGCIHRWEAQGNAKMLTVSMERRMPKLLLNQVGEPLPTDPSE